MVIRQANPYFMVPKRIILDGNLSLAARGLAAYLSLACQNGEDIDTAKIETTSTPSEISCAVSELFDAGYITTVNGKNIFHL